MACPLPPSTFGSLLKPPPSANNPSEPRPATSTRGSPVRPPLDAAPRSAVWQTDRHGHWWPVLPADPPVVLDLLASGNHQRAWKRSADRIRRALQEDK
mmetsp:Transcript_73994/g.130557  ORF Transcript_73994/g.130557 Transcript_73994/m.130557 type:complete len:98 (-) Transcript_73994:178-471(-)